jgi:hypothetical protein
MRYAIAPKGNVGGITPAAITAPGIRPRIHPDGHYASAQTKFAISVA